jgi:hypothetical protein
MGSNSPYRDDAAVVYRYIRDHPGATVPEMADQCFPLAFGDADPLYPRLRRKSVTRVLNALVWMRHEKVLITAVPAAVQGFLTTFWLGAHEIDPLKVARGGVAVLSAEAVTGEVSQRTETESPAWGGDSMGVYHPD